MVAPLPFLSQQADDQEGRARLRARQVQYAQRAQDAQYQGQPVVTEGTALMELNAHIDHCGDGCERGPDGMARFPEMCPVGQSLVQRYLHAEADA